MGEVVQRFFPGRQGLAGGVLESALPGGARLVRQVPARRPFLQRVRSSGPRLALEQAGFPVIPQECHEIARMPELRLGIRL